MLGFHRYKRLILAKFVMLEYLYSIAIRDVRIVSVRWINFMRHVFESTPVVHTTTIFAW